MRVFGLAALAASANAVLLRTGTTGLHFSPAEVKAAEAGQGLPGCDKDTFIRYRVLFCGPDSQDGAKALKDTYFNRLLADTAVRKTSEKGWKAWKQPTINDNGMTVCHMELGQFAGGDQCAYQFKDVDESGATVDAPTSAAALFGV